MAALVDGPRNALDPIVARVARRDAHVCHVRTPRERVHRHVHATPLEVKPNGLGDLLAHLRLLGRVPVHPPLKGLGHLMQGRVRLNLGSDLSNEGREVRLDLIEDFGDALGFHLGVETVDRSVINGEIRLCNGIDLACQLEHLRQERREALEVRLSARTRPRAVCLGGELSSLARKLRAHTHVLLVALLGDAHRCSLIRVEV
mmetsp:Transcript_64448/g.158611  ORF Transcript_64448/g.158611 Transcript_64448/m.158611 type:complete len:202 (-) Transcript_64448:452-1057(-)